MEFEYDPAKSAKNLAKHGIDFEAAQRMWDNSKTVTLTAPNPGNDDVRSIVLGKIDGKHWTAITTKRGKEGEAAKVSYDFSYGLQQLDH